MALTVSLMLVTWTSTSNGFDIWYSFNIGGNDYINWWIAYFLSMPYTLLLSILLLSVLLTFPNGKWVPGWTRWFFLLSLLGMILLPIYLCIMVFVVQSMTAGSQEFFTETLPELFRLGVLGLGVLAQIYRLFVTKDPLQRQQLKWIALSLVGMTFFYILYWLNYLAFGVTAQRVSRFLGRKHHMWRKSLIFDFLSIFGCAICGTLLLFPIYCAISGG